MKRTELISCLKLVEPALSGKDLIPVFSCFCFNGKTVSAYDDIVALQHALPFEVKGGIRGRLLLGFLTASRAQDVAVEQEGQQVTLRLGRSKFDTTALPETDFAFVFPKEAHAAGQVPVTKALLQAMGKAQCSMGSDPTHPWRMGVTLVSGKKGLTLYSSDNRSATRVFVAGATMDGVKAVVLPPRFCEMLLTFSKATKPDTLLVGDAWVQVRFGGGSLRLFSRTTGKADASSYEQVFSSALKDDVTFADVPKGLQHCLERAAAVLPFSKDPYSRLRAKDNKLILSTESSAGNVRDVITLDGIYKCDELVSPTLLGRMLSYANQFAVVSGSCIVLKGERFLHLVSTMQEKTIEE